MMVIEHFYLRAGSESVGEQERARQTAGTRHISAVMLVQEGPYLVRE